MDKRHTAISDFLAQVLRQRPDEIGITLDGSGWVEIDLLLEACRRHGQPITRNELDFVVEHNPKKRFAVSGDGLRIRSAHGHSTELDLAGIPGTPPELLYHGTAREHLETVREHGLLQGKRHLVHLCQDEASARIAAQRHGWPVIFTVRAGEMARAGFKFYQSGNGVWLTDSVPYHYVDETS